LVKLQWSRLCGNGDDDNEGDDVASRQQLNASRICHRC
jgi:hypothetical protein